MRRERHIVAIALLVSATILLFGCQTEEDAGEQQAAVDTEEWAWLQSTHETLLARRAELKKLNRLANGLELPEGETAPEEWAELSAEEIGQKASELEQEIYSMVDEYVPRLTEFINNQGMVVGAEPTEIQKQALRMNSAEAMAVADEFIEKGGDYNRAIDIYNQALGSDPDNEILQAAVASAEEMRFMSEDRFAQVKNKMTETDVRNALGPVNLRNIKDYPDRGVKAWFYRKADGGAAAVWFRQRKNSEEWEVYKTNFEEIKQQVVGGETEEEEVS